MGFLRDLRKEEVHLDSGPHSCSFTVLEAQLETSGKHNTAQGKPRHEYQKVNRNRIKCDTFDTEVTLIVLFDVFFFYYF